ncbi:MAG: serine hydrolase [Pseudomonadota bacterium]
MYKVLFLMSLLLSMCVENVFAEQKALSDKTLGDLDKALHFYQSHFGVVGQAVVILQQGQIVYESYLGLADIEHQVPVTKNSIFPVYSLSKLLANVEIMQLVESGKIKMDVGIKQYLDHLPTTWQNITLEQLLSHTSGLPEYFTDDYAMRNKKLEKNEAEVIDRISDKPFQFVTSTDTCYNQTNYLLIRQIIEKLHNKNYTSIIKQSVFQPLNLLKTGFSGPTDVIPNRVDDYYAEQGKIIRQYYFDFPPYAHAHSGLHANALNLATWLTALVTGQFVNKTFLPDWFKATKYLDGSSSPYAKGWEYHQEDGVIMVGHDGGNKVSVRHLFLQEERHANISVIYLTNGYQKAWFSMAELSKLLAAKIDQRFHSPLLALRYSMYQSIVQGRSEQAYAHYRQFRLSDEGKITSTESTINTLGYMALYNNLGQENVFKLFKENVKVYPKSSKSYASLGRAYLHYGNHQLAEENYQQALRLNPQSKQIYQILKKIKQQKTHKKSE